MIRAGDAQAPKTSPDATIIIRTQARAERAASLRRAISSIGGGTRDRPHIVVVVSGSARDPDLLAELSTREDLTLLQLGPDDFADSMARGVEAVRTPFFGFLDDDDEYLPGAVDKRIEALAAEPTAALVVTNGFRAGSEGDRLALHRLDEVEADPLKSLFEENWLPSCAGLFRRSVLPEDLFRGAPPFLEWTWVAFRLASAGGKVIVRNEPLFRIHTTARSESKSRAYLVGRPSVLRKLLAQAQRADVRRHVREHLTQALYWNSRYWLARGEYRRAWVAQLQCLRYPEGWRYAGHVARLLQPGRHGGASDEEAPA